MLNQISEQKPVKKKKIKIRKFVGKRIQQFIMIWIMTDLGSDSTSKWNGSYAMAFKYFLEHLLVVNRMVSYISVN